MRRLLFGITMLLVACAQEQPATTTTTQTTAPQMQPPSVDDARKIIQSSMEFGEFQFTDAAYSLPVSHSTMNDPQKAAARDLQTAGWIALDGAGDVMLSDKARTDKRFLLRSNGILDIVPLAKKEMGEVQAVRANPDGTAAADFTWHWLPNEVGGAFLRNQFEGTRNATATLLVENGEWKVLTIAAR
ncbi:MAG TPA: hypothetical protein VKB93_23375 [Thermoanaerobaculia bacterium]|nr:hypothetical protein [Thermoanaerobaculia bacterium]